MGDEYGKDLVRYFAPRLKREFPTEPMAANDIALALDRLRLAETVTELRRAEQREIQGGSDNADVDATVGHGDVVHGGVR